MQPARGLPTPADGITTTRWFAMGATRYAFDFAHIRKGGDWYQIDTEQDASYYGTWCNPAERRIVLFTEGDICELVCLAPSVYLAEVARIVQWNVEQGYSAALDDHDGQHDTKANTAPLEWDALWREMAARPDDWIPTTEDQANEMLGCVPPKRMQGRAFLVGEAHHHNNHGEAVYAAFRPMPGGRWAAKYLTAAEFDARER